MHYSHVGLYYDSVYTISSRFFKKFLYFFPFGIALLIYFIFLKEKELQSSCIKLQLTLLQGINHLFLLRDFKALLKILKLLCIGYLT